MTRLFFFDFVNLLKGSVVVKLDGSLDFKDISSELQKCSVLPYDDEVVNFFFSCVI